MDQNEAVMSDDDDDNWTTESEGATTTSENSESDWIDEIEDARKALASCPPNHPDHAERAMSLGYCLYRAYGQIGHILLLNEAIQLEREALALQPPGHPGRARCCANLACSLQVRYKQTGNAALLDEMIELEREALALRPQGNPNRANSGANLAVSLHTRYQQTGNVALLDEVIELNREALALPPQGNPDRASSCANLAASLYLRYEQTGDVALLDEAIELNREALALRPPGHPDRARSCVGLGSSLRMRYQQTGNVALLDGAIQLEREALALQPPGHPGRARCCANLAGSLQVRYKQTGDVALLDEVIELNREALALRPPGHPGRDNSCAGLAVSLAARYQQTGNVALLDEVIELNRESLMLRPLGHPNRDNSCANLAISLELRYKQTGNVALLDEAIELNREALALQPPGHPHRANGCANLSASFHMRYDQTGDVTLLDEVIELEREALALRPLGHPDRARSCFSLGSSLHMCYEQTGNVALVGEAIELKREALVLQPPGHPNRANSCTNLAVSLVATRYEQTSDVALLNEAIELNREALALRPPGHSDQARSLVNLADCLSLAYEQGGDLVLLDEAIEVCRYASKYSSTSWAWCPLIKLYQLHLCDSPHYSVSKALEYLQQSFQHEADDARIFIFNVCSLIEVTWAETSGWTSHTTIDLVTVYTQLVDKLPLVAGFVLNTSSRLKTLLSASQVGSDACVAALLAEQSATAVALLDRAHGIVWTQALHQRDPQMEGAPKDLAIELDNLLRAIATVTPVDAAGRPDHHEDLRHRQNTRIQVILREIRAMPGLARFMLGSTYETLREAARDHPVVVLVAGHGHAFAVIMLSSADTNPDLLPLDVAWNDLRSLADPAGKANIRYRAGPKERQRAETSVQELPLVESTDQERAMRTGNFASEWSPLASLWRDVVKPVLTRLDLMKEKEKDKGPSRRPRLHWCIAGEFAHIPVHAAGIYTGKDQECCSDYVVSSYTPTLATLLRARKSLQPIKITDAKLLLIATKHTADADLPPLGKVEVEMGDICSIVDKAGVHYAASSQSVSKTEEATAALPAANLVHIACHGLQHVSEPLESAFHLSDHDVLSVSDLMKLDLKGAFLAFLSACETAKGDRDQPDQAIHLAATMLFVGFKSVVATMWAMRDEDGPVVSKAFYEKLLEGEMITADTIPHALDHAVRKLRESGAPVGSWATFIHVGA